MTWQQTEEAIRRAVVHFATTARIAAPDAYVVELAQRHAIQCGYAELNCALSMLHRLHPRGAGFTLLSEPCRQAYLAIRALAYGEMVEPSDIDAGTLLEAITAATAMAVHLPADIERIKQEVGDV